MNHKSLLIDTDAGVDDILALYIVWQLSNQLTIDVAVTFGNVTVDQALSNVATLAQLSNFNPRQWLRGSSAPLRGAAPFAYNVHGDDGIGGASHRPEWRAKKHILASSLFTNSQVAHYDKVITIGPLSDIATLCHDGFSHAPLFVMGGAIDAPGNISPFAEFNFYSDPVAASSVFASYVGDIFLVPLDVCHQVVLSRSYLKALCAKNANAATSFLNFIHQHYMDFYKRTEGIDGCYPHDTICVCAALFQNIFSWDRGRVRVIADGPERGRSIFTRDKTGSHYVAQKIDVAQFFRIFERAMVSNRVGQRRWALSHYS